MTAHDWLEVFILFAGAVLSVIGWLITNKVSRLEGDIEKLEVQVQTRKDKQIELELKLAEKHPTNEDIRDLMADFRKYLDERFGHIEEIARGYARGDNTGHHKPYGGGN